MGLAREVTENDRAQVSFSLPRCLTYWNLVLSVKGVLPEQSIVESGQSKVSVVKRAKSNIIYPCYVRAERPEKGKKNLTFFLHSSANVLVVVVLVSYSVCAAIYKGL